MADWISVKDRKPGNGWLIICYKYYADPSILNSDFGLHEDGVFISGGLIREVTHWMPLPSPPKTLE